MAEKKASNVKEETSNGAGEKLLKAACEAFGIAAKYVLSSKYYPEEKKVVIVTHGGAKVRYSDGDEMEKLDPIRVDGIIRKKMKPITGAKKKK